MLLFILETLANGLWNRLISTVNKNKKYYKAITWNNMTDCLVNELTNRRTDQLASKLHKSASAETNQSCMTMFIRAH